MRVAHFYNHLSAALGTIWLVKTALELAAHVSLELGHFGVVFVCTAALTYATIRVTTSRARRSMTA